MKFAAQNQDGVLGHRHWITVSAIRMSRSPKSGPVTVAQHSVLARAIELCFADSRSGQAPIQDDFELVELKRLLQEWY